MTRRLAAYFALPADGPVIAIVKDADDLDGQQAGRAADVAAATAGTAWALSISDRRELRAKHLRRIARDRRAGILRALAPDQVKDVAALLGVPPRSRALLVLETPDALEAIADRLDALRGVKP